MKTGRWLPRLGLVAVILLSAVRAVAEEGDLRPSGPEVRKAVIATIDAQLAAFRQNDRMKAYGFAAGPLRAKISPGRFAEIIARNYPEMLSSTRADYGIVSDNGVRAAVSVRVSTAGGSTASYDYILLKEPAGWRIEGVVPSPKERSENSRAAFWRAPTWIVPVST